MKSYTSILLLLLLWVAPGAATDAWRTHIDFVNNQNFGFGTGNEPGAEMKVEIYHQCRMDTAQRTYVGEFFPSSSVSGIDADTSSVINNPGEGNSISFSFTEGISDNVDIYTDNGDNTAKVEFCVQVGLYASGDLINFAEVKLTYWVDLITHFTSLQGYTVTQAEQFNDQGTQDISYDGTLLAYFCNPYDYQELYDDGSISHQGSVMNLCFKAPDSQFEVADIMDLTVKNALDETPSQTIISGGVITSPGYAEKQCFDSGDWDTNLCMVSFVLVASFYDFHAITLTGSGSVKLEFGGATGGRFRRLALKLDETHEERQLQGGSTAAGFKVKAMQIHTEPNVALKENSKDVKAPVAMIAVGIFVVLFLAAVIKIVFNRNRGSLLGTTSRGRKKESRYRQIRRTKSGSSDCCGSSCMTNDTSIMDAIKARKLGSSSMTNDTSIMDATRERRMGRRSSSMPDDVTKERLGKMPPARFSSFNSEDLDAQRLSCGSAVATAADGTDEEHALTTIDMDNNDLQTKRNIPSVPSDADLLEAGWAKHFDPNRKAYYYYSIDGSQATTWINPLDSDSADC